MTDHKNALRSGTVLDNRYRLEAVLGAGGFGIVYRASQTHLGTQHAIKEYLPQEIALREGTTVHALSSKSREDYEEGLARFLSEARQLVPFAGHPNIVNCTDFFEANGTAYLVMQYEDGLALDELAAAREQNGEPFEEDEIVGLMYPLLRGLQVVHEANVLHRDIKLGNIFIRRADEQPVLLDFGAAKQEFSKHSKSRGAPYTPGYAAPEQVEEEGQLGPWTDIHAVGAVFYRLMAGEVPIKSESRTMRLLRGQADPVQEGLDKLEGEGRFSTSLIKAVRACLAVEVKDRVPSVMELLLRLDSRSSTGPQSPEWETAPESPMSEFEASNIPGLDGEMRGYLDAALGGDARAQFDIGMWCAWNPDVPADESKALYWLEKSAAGGFMAAYEEIGECYINKGMPEKAIKPLEIATVHGFHGATYNLAHLYLEGKGVTKDVGKAIQCLKKIRDANEEWSDAAIEDLASIESEVTNSEANGPSSGSNESGQDITHPLLIDPELARTGGEKKVAFPLPSSCAMCGGSGLDSQSGKICQNCGGLGWLKEETSWKVRIHKGVKTGDRYRFRGKGEPGRNGGQDGDMYFLIEVAEDSSSASRGLSEISHSIEIEPDLASQGGRTMITLSLPEKCGKCSGTGRNDRGACRHCRGEGSTTIERSYKVSIPPGTRDHQKIRISDADRSGKFGNQVQSIILDIRIAQKNEGGGSAGAYQKKSVHIIAKATAKAVAVMLVALIYMLLVMWFWVSLLMEAYIATAISAMLLLTLIGIQKILLPKLLSARDRWNLLKEAEQGDANAQYNAGLMYCFGRDVPQDYAEAFEWFRKSSEGGNENAQYNLAVLYMNGNGVRQNNFEAVRWLRRAADQGSDDAQLALGVLYSEGRGGLKKDITQAARWYQKAAEQGNVEAEDHLGKIMKRKKSLSELNDAAALEELERIFGSP